MKRFSVVLLVTLAVSAIIGTATFFFLMLPARQESQRLQADILRVERERRESQNALADYQAKRLDLQKELSLYSVFDLRKSTNKITQAAITTNMSVLSYIEILKRHHITIEEVLPLTDDRPKEESPAELASPPPNGIRPQGQGGFSQGPSGGGFGKVSSPPPAPVSEEPEFDTRKYRLKTHGLYLDYVAAFDELRQLPPTIQMDRCEVTSEGLDASQAILRVSYGLSIRMLQDMGVGGGAAGGAGGGFSPRSGFDAPPSSGGGFFPKKTSERPPASRVAAAFTSGLNWFLGFPADAKPRVDASSGGPVDRAIHFNRGEIRLVMSRAIAYRRHESKDPRLYIFDLPAARIQRTQNFETPLRGIRWLHLGQFKNSPERIGRIAFMAEDGFKPIFSVSPNGDELIIRVGGHGEKAEEKAPTPATPLPQTSKSRFLFPVIGQFELGRIDPFRKLVLAASPRITASATPSQSLLPSPPAIPPSPTPSPRKPKPIPSSIVLRGVFLSGERATSAFIEVNGQIARVKAGSQLSNGLSVLEIQPSYVLLQGKENSPVIRIDWMRDTSQDKAVPS